MAEQNANEISEQLFQAVDAIVEERIRFLDYDKTVVATIIDNTSQLYGKYSVTTDDNINFLAYSDITNYKLNDKVYVRIPGNDYTKQKVIIGRYVQKNRTAFVPDFNNNSIESLLKTVQEQSELIKKQQENINNNITQIDNLKKQIAALEKKIPKTTNAFIYNLDTTLQANGLDLGIPIGKI